MVAGVVGVALAGGRRRGRRPERGRDRRRSASMYAWIVPSGTAGPASDTSTDEPRNSSTTLRDVRTRSESVWTSIPASTVARAGRREHARAGDLDDAHAADVDRREVLGVAQGRRVDALLRGRRRGSSCPAGTVTGRAVDRQLDVRRRLDRRRAPAAVEGRAGGLQDDLGQRLGGRRLAAVRRRPGPAPGRGVIDRPGRVLAHSATSSGWRRADSIADDAVWPSPQIDASRIAWPISRSSDELLVARADARAGREPRQQLLLADAADAARHALAARLVAEELGDAPQRVDEVDGLVEDHDHARAERRPGGARRLEGQRHVERVRPDEHAGRPAEQDRPDLAAARGRRRRASIRSRSVAPNSTS